MKIKNNLFSRSVLLVLLAVLMTVSLIFGRGTPETNDDSAVYSGFEFAGQTEQVAAKPTDRSYKDMKLIPGGIAFGVKFYTKGILVVGFDDVMCGGAKKNPAFDAGIRAKDVLTEIDKVPLTSAAQLSEAIESSFGNSVSLTYIRNGKEYQTTLTPAISDADGKYKTGLWVRDSGAGIGTVTYIDPDTLTFGGLGHGICDGETGSLIPMERGNVLSVRIGGIERGRAGSPGEIRGYFSSGKLGTLYKNTSCGVFGAFSDKPAGLIESALPVSSKKDLKDGDAYIICTLDENGAQKYSVKISEINTKATGNKCFTVTVTDEKLIEKTGGIVQGMSGSPIIQNGKLVGAVTHVLVNDPTKGYGIFIENMLDAAG